MDELDRLAIRLEERKKNRIAELAFQNVKNINDINDQLDILISLDNVDFIDLTNDSNLPSELKGGKSTKAQILLSDGIFQAGRLYGVRPHSKDYPVVTSKLAHNLNTSADATLSLQTNFGELRRKKFRALLLAFWADSSRSSKDTSHTRAISLDEVLITGDPRAASPTVTTKWRLWAGSGGELTAGDVVKLGDALPLVLPQFHELLLTVSIATTDDCYCDAVIVLETD